MTCNIYPKPKEIPQLKNKAKTKGNNTRSLVYSTQYMLREIPLMLCLLSPPHTAGEKKAFLTRV